MEVKSKIGNAVYLAEINFGQCFRLTYSTNIYMRIYLTPDGGSTLGITDISDGKVYYELPNTHAIPCEIEAVEK